MVAARDLVAGTSRDARFSSRPSPPVPIQVRVDNQGASSQTILEVITKDRADLLFWISQMIYNAGLTIELAKIHTEGVRVTDVFYVRTAEHQKLSDPQKIEALKQSITNTLLDLEGGVE
jgi:[protein-PII] uridylyltransferase